MKRACILSVTFLWALPLHAMRRINCHPYVPPQPSELIKPGQQGCVEGYKRLHDRHYRPIDYVLHETKYYVGPTHVKNAQLAARAIVDYYDSLNYQDQISVGRIGGYGVGALRLIAAGDVSMFQARVRAELERAELSQKAQKPFLDDESFESAVPETIDIGVQLNSYLQSLRGGNEFERIQARESIRILFEYVSCLYASPAEKNREPMRARSELAALRAASEEFACRAAGQETKDVRERLLNSFMDSFERGNERDRATAVRSLFEFLERMLPSEDLVPKSATEKAAAWKAAHKEATRKYNEERVSSIELERAKKQFDEYERAEEEFQKKWGQLHGKFIDANLDMNEKQMSAERANQVYLNALAEDVSASNADRLRSERDRAVRDAENAKRAFEHAQAQRTAHEATRPKQMSAQATETEVVSKRDGVRMRAEQRDNTVSPSQAWANKKVLLERQLAAALQDVEDNSAQFKQAKWMHEHLILNGASADVVNEHKTAKDSALSDLEKARRVASRLSEELEAHEAARPKSVVAQAPVAEGVSQQVHATRGVEENNGAISHREWLDKKRAQVQKGAVVKQLIDDKVKLADTLRGMYQDLLSAKAFEAAERYKSQIEAAELEVERALEEGDRLAEEIHALDALLPKQAATEMVKY